MALSFGFLLTSRSSAESVRIAMAPLDSPAGRDFSPDLALDLVWEAGDNRIELTICNLGAETLILNSFTPRSDQLSSPTLVRRNGSVWLSGERNFGDAGDPPVAPFTTTGLPGGNTPARILTVRYTLPEGARAEEVAAAILGTRSAPAWLDLDAELARLTPQGLEDLGRYAPLIVVPLPQSTAAGALCLGGLLIGNIVRRRALRAT